MRFEKSEYEISLFRFSAEELKLEYHLRVKQKIAKLTAVLIISILKSYGFSQKTITLLKSKKPLIIESIHRSLYNIFIEFDEKIEEYFNIPDNILLIRDFVQEYATEAEEAEIEEKIKNLKIVTKQNANFLSILNREQSNYEAKRLVFYQQLQILQKLQNSFNSSKNFSIRQNQLLLKEVKTAFIE